MNTISMTLHPLRAALGRFRRGEDASLSVEAVLVLPILLWAFLATFTFFDVYRAKNLSLKANYAISDLFSRETNVLDMDYLEGAESLFEYLTQSGESSWVRLTVVHCDRRCDQDDRRLRADWSRATDGQPTYDNAGVMESLEPIVPWIASGERIVIVESSMQYSPPFSMALTGIGARTFTDIVMTRPRFAPQLCWQGLSCGT